MNKFNIDTFQFRGPVKMSIDCVLACTPECQCDASCVASGVVILYDQMLRVIDIDAVECIRCHLRCDAPELGVVAFAYCATRNPEKAMAAANRELSPIGWGKVSAQQPR